MTRLVLAAALTLTAPITWAQSVPVRYTEGSLHGFLVVRTLEGKVLADGDIIQTASGDRVTTKLVFRFADGSFQEETTVFSQGKRFRLISNRLVQKGPSFPQPLTMTVDGRSGEVTVKYSDEDGKAKVDTDKVDAPSELANGLLLTLLKNVGDRPPPKTVSMVVATPKPRVVKLEISPPITESFTTNGMPRKALHYVIKVNLGGISGLVAPIVGKQPPDSHVWMLQGDVPVFVKAEQPFYAGGPLWRIELTSPTWPHGES
jgi:hypothetical protein